MPPRSKPSLSDPPGILRTGCTFVKLCNNSRATALLSRYYTRCTREFQQSLHLLLELRATPPQPDAPALPPDVSTAEEVAATRPNINPIHVVSYSAQALRHMTA